MMIGFGNDTPLIDDHRANHRVGVRFPFPTSRQRKGTLHVETIRLDRGHRLFEEIGDFLRGADLDVAFFLADVFFTIVFLAETLFVTVFFLDMVREDLAEPVGCFLTAFLEER